MTQDTNQVQDRDAVIDKLATRAESTQLAEETIAQLMLRVITGDDSTGGVPMVPTDEELAEAEAFSESLVYDNAILLRKVADALDDFAKTVGKRADRAAAMARDIMVDTGTQSIKRHGRTLYVATERTITPRISDLLPDGVDPDDPTYKDTVAQVKAHAMQRLIKRMGESELADLVETKYNSNSLRSRLVGTKAEKDENGDPIIPEAVADLIDVGEFYRAKIKK
jgi:hypothetical protein